MKVYVLETGVYDNRAVYGVYRTAEDAVTAWQPDREKGLRGWRPRHAGDLQPTYEWKKVRGRLSTREAIWVFDGEWDDAAEIFEYELESNTGKSRDD